MPQKTSLLVLAMVLATCCSCRPSPATLVGGVWVVTVPDREAAVKNVKDVPEIYRWRYKTVDEYRNWLHQQISNTEFEFFADGTAKCRGGWYTNDRLVWRTDGPGQYWVTTAPGFFPVATVGHGIALNSDGTATCRFQVEWSEDAATRIPVVMRKRPRQ